jgi:signal transduction histidine kinase
MECEENPEELKRYEKYIGHITGQVDRLRKMTDAFMKFARVEKPQLSPCDVREILQEVLTESRLKMGSGVHVKIQWDQELPRIAVDRQQLSVAFQNLIDNSLNAMEGKGVLTVTARLVQTLYNNHIQGLKDGIQIELSDTGKGISPNHQARLFQPFFSKSALGTGLGLVIVKKIVEDHHGSIRIESEEGIGTTVFITLPINNGKKDRFRPARSAQKLRTDRECIRKSGF